MGQTAGLKEEDKAHLATARQSEPTSGPGWGLSVGQSHAPKPGMTLQPGA